MCSSAPQEVADSRADGLGSDGFGEGWSYGKHAASPEPREGYRVYGFTGIDERARSALSS